MTVDGLRVAVGDEVGVGDWVTVDQDRIDRFADVTEDHQWIHQAGEDADRGPFGGPIAHGFLTLSLVPRLLKGFPHAVDGVRMSVNYGLDKVRFITPVKAGAQVRARCVLLSAEPSSDGGIQLKYGTTVEIEGEERPAAYVENLVRVFR